MFAVTIALKLLLKEEDYSRFHHKLFSRIMSIKSKLKTINLQDLLDLMNFSNNCASWKNSSGDMLSSWIYNLQVESSNN